MVMPRFPVPSVIEELGITTRPSRLRESSAAVLLAKPLAGMPSDATVEQVSSGG